MGHLFPDSTGTPVITTNSLAAPAGGRHRKVNITGIKDSTHHILNATGYFEYTIIGHGGIGRFIESDILVFLIAAFIHIPDEF